MTGPASAGIGEKLINFAVRTSSSGQDFKTQPPTLDSDSEACLQCHNETGASNVVVKSAFAPMQIWGGRSANHPVGMIYDQFQAKSPEELVPLQRLNPAIELVDGRVGCLSCHALKSSEMSEPLPVVSNISLEDSNNCTASDQLTVWGNQTDLCLSCHNK
ncbi:MAG: hypothetical protein JXR49_22625 [Acidobacteria bacterium]|nr:hypothetical protein [Acidobacteriota bacterium]